MCRLLSLTFLFSGLAFAQSTTTQSAGDEIFRCPQPDGTVAFQGMPCSEPESAEETADDEAAGEDQRTENDDDPFDFVNPFDEPAPSPEPEIPSAPAPLSTDRAECEKSARDAIDAIDLQMRQGYSKAEGQAYMAELLKLTSALRACKEL